MIGREVECGERPPRPGRWPSARTGARGDACAASGYGACGDSPLPRHCSCCRWRRPAPASQAAVAAGSTGTWALTGSLHTARSSHTATLLQDGKVLVAGGHDGSGTLASAERYTEVPCTGRAEEDIAHGIVAFGKGWRHLADARASGGGLEVADTPGAQASFRFPGRGTRLVATTGPEMGQLDISVDGKFWGTADLYSPTIKHQQVVAFVHGLSEGTHTVTYRVSAKKNPKSSGCWCPLDRFDHHTTE